MSKGLEKYITLCVHIAKINVSKHRITNIIARAHWNFLPKFLSLHYYTTLEGVLGVQRSKQAQENIICLFDFSQNGMTLKKNQQK